MKTFIKRFLIILPIFLCLILASALAWERLYQRYRPISFETASFQETNDLLDNPFRGFYHLYGLILSEDDPENIALQTRQCIQFGSLPLMLFEINLKNYADTDLSDNALTQLDQILLQLQDAGRQVILRFLYDWEGMAVETEPSAIEQIIRHMDQVGPVVNCYADTVFLLQGTFTGDWGEMNQTKYGSHEDNRLLMTHLAQATDPSIFLTVRTPSQLRGVTQTRTPISSETAFDGSLNSRLGLFNDGMLGSVYDLGTYDDTPNAGTDEPEDKGTREEELSFQEYLCQYVPNGGEAVIDNPFSDFDRAIPDLAQMHITYLNCDYDAAVMDKWKKSVYHGNDCFDGMNGFDYISAHLGYRYLVTDCSYFNNPLEEGSGIITLSIENRGFAPSYRLFMASLTLEHTDTHLQLTMPVELDNRVIGGGSQTSFQIPLSIDELPQGNYKVSFSLTDPYTGQTIQFANQDKDDAHRVHLGTLTVEQASPKGLLSFLLGKKLNE